ncbi:MAG: dephospho-CoA kinase [Pirellulaceae bacterium]|nr:dephospho-CoA kinase [Pirellulaceae bacterium]
MKIIGVLGGIASGKSRFCEALGELGARILSADKIAHAQLEKKDVLEAVVQKWGTKILNQEGEIDRKKLAASVFNDSDRLAELETILHPLVKEEIDKKIAEYAAAGIEVVVLDVPLLLEVGWCRIGDEKVPHENDQKIGCDEIVFIETPLEDRRQRSRVRGWDQYELTRREAQQAPLEEKKRIATFIADGGGSLRDLNESAKTLWERVTAK